MKTFKKLDAAMKDHIALEVKNLLHAGYDCLRNQDKPPGTMLGPNNGYYAEAFGVMRALVVMGYGYFGAVNTEEEGNVGWWFNKLHCEVREEEGFYGNYECDHCVVRWGKDWAGRKRL